MHLSKTHVATKPEWEKNAHINRAKYQKLYQQSLQNPDRFWAEQAERVTWTKKWDRVKNTTFNKPVSIKWYEGGQLNACYNCIDRHLPEKADRVAFYWVPDNPQEEGLKITYQDLHEKVSRLAQSMKDNGVKKADRVTIYMPMIPEAIYSMLACARIGAIHSVVFGGFSPDSLATRIQDCDSEFMITADEGYRGGKKIPLKANADRAAEKCPRLKKVFVVKRTGGSINWNTHRDIWYHEATEKVSTDCPPENMDAEDPLYILYTSGSTGKPKGVMHTTGGYMVYTSLTHEIVFDYKPDDVYWCAADVGWVTGHSYIVYGPLANGATSVLFEGVPTWPTCSRIWEIIDTYKVNILYTAPTLIRTLMRDGDEFVKKTSRQSLRLLGSVGEPINPEAWRWYYEVAGDSRCPIVDTWWQTETGGIMITPLVGAADLKPGSASLPFFGVQPLIVNDEGQELTETCEGNLCFKESWPGQMRTVYKNHQRFEETYFSQFPGMYFAGDSCYRDEDGYYWIIGRVDDVINVSGHRMGTAEVESSLVAHNKVAEAAVVGYPHDLKGQGIYAYVTLMAETEPSDELRTQLRQWVGEDIGPIAKPDVIQFTSALPKTRSGKIMRRILRKIASKNEDQVGDTSTLANPHVVNTLVQERNDLL